MRPEFLTLSDVALAERIHQWEARSTDDDTVFEQYRHHRAILSFEAWQSLTDELGCDRGPLAEVGVMVFPLDEDLASRLLQALLGPPAIFVSLAILVFLNIASLGATYTPPVMAPHRENTLS